MSRFFFSSYCIVGMRLGSSGLAAGTFTAESFQLSVQNEDGWRAGPAHHTVPWRHLPDKHSIRGMAERVFRKVGSRAMRSNRNGVEFLEGLGSVMPLAQPSRAWSKMLIQAAPLHLLVKTNTVVVGEAALLVK